jgi:pimeloyl-ACP methyl ester carboxylesterase
MESPVVLIHGAFAGPWSMENFTTFFRDLGWTCHAPALRFHDADPGAVPDPDLAGTSIEDYTDDIAAFVQTLDAPAILVGHSMGGVIAQKLAARGLARAVVLLNGSVSWGILPSTDEERAVGTGLMASGPFWETTLRMEFDMMADLALNRLDAAAQRATFARLGPESGRAIFELFFWIFDDRHTTRIDYEKVKCPVLVVSGSDDRGVSGHTARQIATRHGAGATFFEATGFGHYLMLEPGWQAVATRCAEWMSAACELSD